MVSMVILAICIPLTAFVTGYFTLKAVQMGLRWQIEVKQEQKPTMEPMVANPFEAKPQAPEHPLSNQILDEWMNGPKEVRT